MRLSVFLLILLCCISCANPETSDQKSEIENVVQRMNTALAVHDSEALLDCYAAEMDWENSYGWTIHDKATLGRYFSDWLFPRYPALDIARLELSHQITLINSSLAWVDVLQEIKADDLKTVIRTYRQSHFLIKNQDGWVITKSRLWAPVSIENPPLEFISSSSFVKQ